MPIYEYVCSACGKSNDVLQKVDEPAPEACPSCGAKGTLTKAVSRTSFVLKGGGWYSDLYSSTKKKDGGSGGSEPSKGSGGGGGGGSSEKASSDKGTAQSTSPKAAAG